MVKVGIIGCGKIAQVRHIPEYAENRDAELAGFCSLNSRRAEELAGRYGGKVYGSVEELLGDPGVDAVSICSANCTHAKIAVAALKAGKHVLCEKPMAVTLEECEEMVRTAEETGRFLMIGHNQRLAKAHAKARELIKNGEIGEVLSFRTTFGHGGPETWSIQPGSDVWFFDRDKAGMGAMGDLGIHKTDLIQFLTGQRVREVSAKIVTLDKRDGNGERIGVDDHAICIYTMENGITGTMTASWVFYGQEDNSTVLYGTRGIMRIYDSPEFSIQIIREGEQIYYITDQIQTNDNQTASGVIDLFVDCLVHNREPEISGREALNAMRAVFAALESSRSGRAVKIL